jgi:ribosome maturation factor RimP
MRFVDGGFRHMAIAQQERERMLRRDVARLVEPALPGTEVLAVELTGRERFCVFVDHPAGVDHALCERVTSMLRSYLDEYSVEVSSPGFDRPLRTRGHFERAIGRKVRVKTETGRVRGEILKAEAGAVQIQNGAEVVDIPYDEIVRANLIDEGTRG